jgi:cellulose synthase/poly-beta-1,6-N-acetylglucosamine synthase-like glycosyltransferase
LQNKDIFPSVAVLVPVYNEEKVIEKKIRNIFSLDYPANKLSVWIGSDQSTDKTNSIVSNYPDKRIHLWIAEKRGGKTEVLNNLIPQINSEIILLTDANTMHKSDCLKQMVGYFSDSSVGIVAGRVIHMVRESVTGDKHLKGEELAEEMYRSFEVWQKKQESALHSSISAFGGFYCIRKSLFKPIPFNAYSNDDVLIPMNVIRQKKRVIFEEKAISLEDVSGNLKMEFSRRVRIGAGNFQAFFWLLDFLNPFKGWPAFCFISHKVIRWFSPLIILLSGLSLIALYFLTLNSLYFYMLLAAMLFILPSLMHSIIRIKIFQTIFYFLAMNVALLFGLFRYLGGIKSATWSRTERE